MTDGRAGGWMDAKEGEELTPKFGECMALEDVGPPVDAWS